jgi:S-adenosylmethionine hydrolase
VAASRPIVFLTDFGRDDFYAGVMRAVVSASAPASRLVELSHGIDAHDVHQASYVLSLSLEYLAPDAVVVAVVDPGVGSARRALVVEFGTRVIVAPDNGLVSDLLAAGADVTFRAIDEDALVGITGIAPRGATFDGRDVFGPVAAALARGVAAAEIGPEVGGVVMLPDIPSVSIDGGVIRGTGRMIDRFGNILTDIPRAVVTHVFGDRPCRVAVAGQNAGPLRRTYCDGAPDALMALLNSWDRVEAAVPQGRAVERFGGVPPRQIAFELRAG